MAKSLDAASHTYAGKTHAEVLAIKEAGIRARGATLYLNVEPCSHVGRTGPCADEVIAAGIRRVFVAMRDPNPPGWRTRYRPPGGCGGRGDRGDRRSGGQEAE